MGPPGANQQQHSPTTIEPCRMRMEAVAHQFLATTTLGGMTSGGDEHIPPVGGSHPLAVTPPLLTQCGLLLEEVPSSTTGELPEEEEEEEEGEEKEEEEEGWGRRRLGELKVSDLKNECKKRQLAVSGSKQQLLDRLKPFERQILLQQPSTNKCPPPSAAQQSSPPPCSNSSAIMSIGSSSVIDAVIDSVIDGSGLVEGKGTKASGKRTKNAKLECWKGGGVKCKQKGGGGAAKLTGMRKMDKKGTLADLLRGATAFGTTNFNFVERKGAGALCTCGPNGTKKRPSKWPMTAAIRSTRSKQMDSANLPPLCPSTTQFETMTFSFAQMGSGGQFTPMEPADISIGDIPANEGQQKMMENNNENGGNACSAAPPLPSAMAAETKGGRSQKECQCAKFVLPHSKHHPAAAAMFAAAADVEEGGGDRSESEGAVGGWGEHGGGGELMSAATLARHEELLRQQQRKIFDLQRELGRSQVGLDQHQKMLAAEARRMAALARDPAEMGKPTAGHVEFWLGQLETRWAQMERTHREQRELMERQVAGHRELVGAEQRLQEELHTEQAVQDICRLIRQEPKAALLIVQLLRRYQLERSANTTIGGVEATMPSSGPSIPMNQPPHHPPPPPPLLWNGFLPIADPAKVDECQQQRGGGGGGQMTTASGEMTVPTGVMKRDARKRAAAGTKEGGQARRMANGRSNSVLDGLTMEEGGNGQRECAACTMHVGRRPNSSLGTETFADSGRSLGPVDMEEIFRSVLEGGRPAEEAMERPHQRFGGPVPVHSFVPIPTEFLVPRPSSFHQHPPTSVDHSTPASAGAAAPFLDCAPPLFGDQMHSQEMEKTMQDLMEVLRDDQEKGAQMAMTARECPSTVADYQTDQLATFLAEEVELCRNASGTASAVFPAHEEAMAVGSSIRLDQERGGEMGGAAQQQQGFGTTAADLLLFPCPEEADKAMDWLDGFDPFTAVF